MTPPLDHSSPALFSILQESGAKKDAANGVHPPEVALSDREKAALQAKQARNQQQMLQMQRAGTIDQAPAPVSSQPASSMGTPVQPQQAKTGEHWLKRNGQAQLPVSLQPVLARLHKLRAAVNTSVRLYDAAVAEAQREEGLVSSEERAALMARRSTLKREVHVKNQRMKVLIDQLRELHRDTITFRTNMSTASSRATASQASNKG